jgi:hypothetical protein
MCRATIVDFHGKEEMTYSSVSLVGNGKYTGEFSQLEAENMGVASLFSILPSIRTVGDGFVRI